MRDKMGGRGSKKVEILRDVIYGWSLSRLLLREREREPFARFYDSLAELSDFDPLLVAKRQLGFLAVTKEAILQTTN